MWGKQTVGSIQQTVVLGGMVVAFGFPLFGLVVHRFINSCETDTERIDSLPPAHGRDRRL